MGLGWRREAASDAERSQGRARLESREEAHPGKARCGDSLCHGNGGAAAGWSLSPLLGDVTGRGVRSQGDSCLLVPSRG